MNDPTNKLCEQCCESVKRDAKICPHCHFEQFPDSDKTDRKERKRLVKWFISHAARPAAAILFLSGIWGCSVEKDSPDDLLIFLRHCFLALVCLHFYAFHIVYDEDEKKGGGDDGGGGGGGGGE